MQTRHAISITAITLLTTLAGAQSALGPGVLAPGPAAREPVFRAIHAAPPPAFELAPTVPLALAPGSNVSGYVSDAPPIPANAVGWRRDASGRWVYTLELVSRNAEFLRVRFDRSLGEDATVSVYDPWTGASFGPYSRHEIERTEFWSTIIAGDSIGVEVVAPPGAEPGWAPAITHVNYGFVSARDTARGCVPRDASCEPSWQGPADAVCLLATINMDGSLSTFCSGALLNRTVSDGSPLVMTANHCLGSQSRASTTAYVWFWQTLSCNGPMPNFNSLPRSDGSLMLKRHSPSDWNLVGLYEPPGASYYMGWSSGYWDDDTPATGIHHPGGALKQIAFGEKTGESNQTFCDDSGDDCFDADVWNITFSTGFTIGGSSGSPIMSSVGVVRGTLTGGPADDCTLSRYGRFDHAFVNLRYYLHNVASPVYVAVGAGDSGNNGAFERGTSPQPFNTVHEATFAVREGDDVAIGPGDYDERFTVWRPMTLRRAGSSGVVRIGQ